MKDNTSKLLGLEEAIVKNVTISKKEQSFAFRMFLFIYSTGMHILTYQDAEYRFFIRKKAADFLSKAAALFG